MSDASPPTNGGDTSPLNTHGNTPEASNGIPTWATTVASLDNGTEMPDLFNIGGRPRQYANNASRQKAYNERRSEETRQQQKAKNASNMAMSRLKRTDSDKDLQKIVKNSNRHAQRIREEEMSLLYRADFSWCELEFGLQYLRRHKNDIPSWFWETVHAFRVKLDGDHVFVQVGSHFARAHSDDVDHSKDYDVFTDDELNKILDMFVESEERPQLSKFELDMAHQWYMNYLMTEQDKSIRAIIWLNVLNGKEDIEKNESTGQLELHDVISHLVKVHWDSLTL